MEWLQQNWIWLLLLVSCLSMHFGHRHGGGGSHQHHGGRRGTGSEDRDAGSHPRHEEIERGVSAGDRR